jgi:hypothetical protein
MLSTATPQTQLAPSTTISIDPTVLGGLIGGISVVLAALIAGLFVIYQVRRTAHIEQKRQEEQHRHAAEMLRLQQALAQQSKAKEQDEQNAVGKAENLRIATLLAKTNEERIDLYRKSLHRDPHIACLQILSMSQTWWQKPRATVPQGRRFIIYSILQHHLRLLQ